MSSKLFKVGLKDKDGQWHIKLINVSLDSGNNFRPMWPIDVGWPDGKKGKFWKDSINGTAFYKEV